MSVRLAPRTYRARDGSVVACIHARRDNLSQPLVHAMQDAFNEYISEAHAGHSSRGAHILSTDR